MANNDFPILNGQAVSWADVAIKVSPTGGSLIDVKDIKSISYGGTVEVGEQRAPGGRVMRRTTGQSSYEASMVLYRSGFQSLCRQLAALAPARGNQKIITLVHFAIQIQFSAPGDPEIYETRLKGVRILGRSSASAEGTDAETVDVPLSVIEICDVIDGVENVLL